jgi:PAS domain S-box-containing protein
VSQAIQSVVFNAIPLFVLAGAYAALALYSWLAQRRERGTVDPGLPLTLAGVAVAAAVLGVLVLVDRRPLAGHLWTALAALVVLLVAPLALLRRRERPTEAPREGAAERELEAVATLGDALARATDLDGVAGALLDQVSRRFEVDVAALALVNEDATEATGLLMRIEGEDTDWYRDLRHDLVNEPSGVASAVFEAAAFAVRDAEGSSRVSQRMVARVGAKSVAYVPLILKERVVAVLVLADRRARRVFGSDELMLMQALASEAAIALERAQSAAALGSALDRERIVARISAKVRSELDLDAVLRVAVEETARALNLQRCFIRLGEAGGELPIAAEWRTRDAAPIRSAGRLPVSNLAVRERRTVAFGDVRNTAVLEDETLGGREALLGLGAYAALATPIVVFGELIGVLGLHRTEAREWTDGEVALAEAVAREAGLAIHTARLLRERERRIEQQSALLSAAQVLTGELDLEGVLQGLVDRLAELLRAEAADCYLLDRERQVLRCAAVHGMPEELVGFEFQADKGAAGEALRRGRPVIASAYAELADPVPHAAYEGFTDALVAPMGWSGDPQGVLGVGARGGRSFQPEDADLLEAFAGLASLALRNAESFAASSRQARVQRGFYRIASVLGQSLSLPATLDAVAQAAVEAFGGAFGAVFMSPGDRLALAGAFGLPEELRARLADGLPAGAGVLETAARERRVIASPAVADDARFGADWRELALAAQFGSLLAVPIEAPRNESGGLVLVFVTAERRFTDDDLELARHLAGATRGALERSDLFEAERTARALAQQLARTGSLLATELDPEAVLDEVVGHAPALLAADACVIRTVEGDELVVRAAEGEGTEAAADSRSPATGWLSGDVVQSRAPVVVEDAGGDPRLGALDPLLASGYCAFLGVPLVGPEGSLHGVLAVYDRRVRRWREEEVEALLALAGNTSAALSNAELYQRVADEQERSSAILRNIADGIVAVDRDGKVVLWNRAAEEITGVPASEAVSRAPVDVLRRSFDAPGDEPPGVNRQVSILRGGEEVWLSLSEAVMRDPTGAVAGRIFAFRDISADRLVEEMKTGFVSAVSHELRTPLTSIYGFAETLLRQDVLFGEEERRTFLGYIASESERLTAIVDQLLNVARVESGLQVNLAPVDVRSVVAEVAAGARETDGVNGHRFVVDVPDEPLEAVVDQEKLRQILGELVDNAIKYSPDGGTVTIGARRASDKVELRVDDQGIGIPASEQPRIFRKFYRADAQSREGAATGTGLGLFIAEGMVKAMNGRISVTSAEGAGSSFAVELPLAPAAVAGRRE